MAVSETRDVRDEGSRILLYLSLLHNGAAQRIAVAAYAQGIILPSLSFCCGESPRRRRVCDPVCACHGKRLPLRRQFRVACTGPTQPFFRNVECGLGRGSAVPAIGHTRDDMSGPSQWAYCS